MIDPAPLVGFPCDICDMEGTVELSTCNHLLGCDCRTTTSSCPKCLGTGQSDEAQCDNCGDDANADQADLDGDGVGDA